MHHPDGREKTRRERHGKHRKHHQTGSPRRLQVSSSLLDQAGAFLGIVHVSIPLKIDFGLPSELFVEAVILSKGGTGGPSARVAIRFGLPTW